MIQKNVARKFEEWDQWVGKESHIEISFHSHRLSVCMSLYIQTRFAMLHFLKI